MWAAEHSIDTSALPEHVWRLWADVPGWPEWNGDIERIELDGSFALGGRIVMTPIGQEAIELRIAEALAPLDLTHVQFVLLACAWWLNENGDVPNQVAVAAQAGTDIKMTSQVLRTLERKGLIEREVDSADTRARRVRVTKQGARLAPRAIAVVEAVDAEFFSELAPADAVDFLSRVAQLPEPGGRGARAP